jgi:hypothetical protein
MRKVFVKCWRRRQLLATYEFRVPASISSPPLFDGAELISDAKSQLTTDRLAFPPYDDIRCEVIS